MIVVKDTEVMPAIPPTGRQKPTRSGKSMPLIECSNIPKMYDVKE